MGLRVGTLDQIFKEVVFVVEVRHCTRANLSVKWPFFLHADSVAYHTRCVRGGVATADGAAEGNYDFFNDMPIFVFFGPKPNKRTALIRANGIPNLRSVERFESYRTDRQMDRVTHR